MSRSGLLAGVCAAALVLGAGLARAQETAAPTKGSAATVTPEAKRVLDRLRMYYESLKGAGVTLSMNINAGGSNQTQEMTVAFERPNRVAFRSAGQAAGQYMIVCDGETIWNYLGPPLKKYTQEPAPKSFGPVMEAAAMGQPVEERVLMMSPHMLLIGLMDGDRFGALVDGAAKIEFVGTEEIEGKKEDRIRLTGQHAAADLWVRAEGDAWLDRMSPDLSKMMGEDAPKMEISIAFKDWKKRDGVSDDAFAFKAPEGAEKVKSLMEAMQAQMGGDDTAATDLLGKPAPEVALDLLDGGKMTLSSHKDKNIVILDFWATWCKPCVMALPLISKVAAEFKDKGVVFYAVDQQEAAETVKAFLEKQDFKLTVAMDKEGAAGNAYGVSGIPQTVIIGKDGTVQAVHTGFAPDMDKELTEQLKTLLEGKSLAKPAEKKDPK